MTRQILINRSIGETRAAYLEDDAIKDIRLYRDHNPSYVGAIYLGRITKISSEFQAAFVELDNSLEGFLPLKSLPKTSGKKPKDLTTLIHEGQRIIVQVTADAKSGKSLKLTGRIELISTAIVIHPFRAGAFVSSRIKDPHRRAELKEFGLSINLKEFGLTFRTEAANIPLTQLKTTADQMIGHWRAVSKNIKTAKCPDLLAQGPDAIEQIMREFTSSGLTNIIIDQANAHKRAVLWCKNFAPDLKDNISLYNKSESLFRHYDVDEEIEQLSSSQISIKSGGWITIEETEALTVIDVNMGDAQLSNDYELQVLKLNQIAAREIFRQLRLRSIGGIIIIDFINMQNKGQIKSFLHFIDELMMSDSMPLQRGNMSSFGLLELTRKSRQQNLNQLLVSKSELNKNVTSQCLDLLRDAQSEANARPGKPATIKVSAAQKLWLENHSKLFDSFKSQTGSSLKMEFK